MSVGTSFKVHPIVGIGPEITPLTREDVDFEWLRLAECLTADERGEDSSESEEDSDEVAQQSKPVTRRHRYGN